jgi:hypothetical protein
MFTEQLVKIQADAVSTINQILGKQGNNAFELYPPDFEDRDEDFYDLPRFVLYGKYNTFNEYSIISVMSDSNGRVRVDAIETTGEVGDEILMYLDELGASSLLYLADFMCDLHTPEPVVIEELNGVYGIFNESGMNIDSSLEFNSYDEAKNWLSLRPIDYNLVENFFI